jgi:hypothetical protein
LSTPLPRFFSILLRRLLATLALPADFFVFECISGGDSLLQRHNDDRYSQHRCVDDIATTSS